MSLRTCYTFSLIVLYLLFKDGMSHTSEQITTLRAEIRAWIEEATQSEVSAERDIIPGLTRLSFHDCVGGCDGCINKDNLENSGLEKYIDVIEVFYQNNVTLEMSRADFWNLAAIEAMVYASEFGVCRRCTPDPFPIIFRFGRDDCAGGGPYTNDNHTFPDATLSGTHAVKYFASEFGMTAEQTTAIMGAHTLGRAHRGASGFQNKWVERSNRFNNEYYTIMMNESFGWEMAEVVRRSSSKWQWEDTTNELMMLNTDMGLFLDLEGNIDSTGKVTGCDYETCSLNMETLEFMAEYDLNNADWLAAFADAFDKMTMNGYSADPLEVPV